MSRMEADEAHLQDGCAPPVAPSCLPLDRSGWRAVKRLGDLTMAVPLFVVSLPLQAAIAAVVKLTSPGPVFFRQQRVGRAGRTIHVVKFRSMCVDAEDRLRADPELFEEYLANGFKLHAHRDQRLTRVGRLLRKSSLDELPQLWGVITGDLSLVGPRPVLPEELVTLHGQSAHLYLAVKPGMTGPWQVAGRSQAAPGQRRALVAEYVQNWTPWRDLSIVLRTIPAVLSGRGAH